MLFEDIFKDEIHQIISENKNESSYDNFDDAESSFNVKTNLLLIEYTNKLNLLLNDKELKNSIFINKINSFMTLLKTEYNKFIDNIGSESHKIKNELGKYLLNKK